MIFAYINHHRRLNKSFIKMYKARLSRSLLSAINYSMDVLNRVLPLVHKTRWVINQNSKVLNTRRAIISLRADVEGRENHVVSFSPSYPFAKIYIVFAYDIPFASLGILDFILSSDSQKGGRREWQYKNTRKNID